MSNSLLSLRDVEAGYGETQVLEGISLDVNTGETVSLIGRNGVGKTTTLRSILGAVTPTGGTITYDGEDITALDPVETVKRGVGLVPEERRVFPGLSVEENLRIGSFGGSDTPNRRDVDQILDTFENLSRRRESRGVDLSGGEQQMLSIGRALVAGADLLMLDEPTEGLAPLIVDRVAELIEEINDEGITVLLVEQNVSVALELADRVYILDKGQVVYEGTPKELDEDESILDRYLGVSV
jgi:branched-chain amino acid transport system ATP-binding protein